MNFPKPELAPQLHEAFVKASMDSPSLPEATPNPSLPEHMKPRTNNGRGVIARQRVPTQHR